MRSRGNQEIQQHFSSKCEVTSTWLCVYIYYIHKKSTTLNIRSSVVSQVGTTRVFMIENHSSSLSEKLLRSWKVEGGGGWKSPSGELVSGTWPLKILLPG